MQTTPYDGPGTLSLLIDAQDLGEIPTGSLQTGAQNRGVVGYNRRFSTDISLHLRNGTRQRHSYYGTVIGTGMSSIKWCYFQ